MNQKDNKTPWTDSLIASYAAKPESENLGELRFPTRKDEYWKYTRTNQIAKNSWSFQDAEISSDQVEKVIDGINNSVVFINGKFDADHSIELPKGISVSNEESAVENFAAEKPFNPFRILNEALPQTCLDIDIEKDTVLDEAINFVFIYHGKDSVANPFNRVKIGANSSVKWIERHIHIGDHATFGNVCTQIRLGENAYCGMDILQTGTGASNHHHEIEVSVEKGARYVQNTFTLSGNWTRNNTQVTIVGENAEANLNGFYIPAQKELIDNHTIIDHQVAHCNSNELYRGVMLDQSTGVFNGKVFVRQDAQKTNAFQSNGNILISDNATMNSKPELEIYADDVKCSHGSTTGQFDDEAMFYLMARGISKSTAQKMLVGAFAADVLELLVHEELHEEIENAIHKKLG